MSPCRTAHARRSNAVLDLTPIPIDRFTLAWRLTDRKYRALPPDHLAQIKPFDAPSARRLADLTAPWRAEFPFTQGVFADVASTSTDTPCDGAVRRVKKWLYARGVPFGHRVLLSWGETTAAATPWKIFVKYWDDFWYSMSDDLVVFDESLSWALFMCHKDEAYFARRPTGADPKALAVARKAARLKRA